MEGSSISATVGSVSIRPRILTCRGNRQKSCHPVVSDNRSITSCDALGGWDILSSIQGLPPDECLDPKRITMRHVLRVPNTWSGSAHHPPERKPTERPFRHQPNHLFSDAGVPFKLLHTAVLLTGRERTRERRNVYRRPLRSALAPDKQKFQRRSPAESRPSTETNSEDP